MKIIFKYIFLLLIVASLSSCQEETVEIQEPLAEEAFTGNAPVAALAQRIALRDGSGDNIINGSSCISFVFPYTVEVFGQQIRIESEKDFVKVERILNQNNSGQDAVQVLFPVTIVLANHTKIVVSSEDELEDYEEECIEGSDDRDIECVDFKYPLEFSLYDAQNQVTDNIVIDNDEELFKFLDKLEDDVYVSLKFPVTLILADGSEINVYNNDELEDIIEDSKDDCDEDDDNDFDDDDLDTSELNTFLINGDWQITYFFDESDNTQIFNGWSFSFSEDGALIATEGSKTFEGDWESYGDSGVLEIDLDFDSVDPVKELNEEWEVKKFSDTRIELEDTSGGAAVTVVFEKV